MNKTHMYTLDNREAITVEIIGDGTFISNYPVALTHIEVDDDGKEHDYRVVKLKLSEVRSLIRSLSDAVLSVEQTVQYLMDRLVNAEKQAK